MSTKPPLEDGSPGTPIIVCRRRKNQPMVSPVICEKRCPRLKNCPSYNDYIQPALFDLSLCTRKAK